MFAKLKSAVSNVAKQGAQILSEMSQGSGGSSNMVQLPPKVELEQLFDDFCFIVDQLSEQPNAESIDAEMRLHQSSARPIFKRIITILQVESDLWVEHQRFHVQHTQGSRKQRAEEYEIPCLEYVLQSNMIQGIVNRALTDTPRGLMPLVLTGISHLLRTIDYPLLPHQSVYKSVAKLISFATRYEAIISEITSTDDEKYLSYRRRIGERFLSFHFLSLLYCSFDLFSF
jgi:hypothetical protein